VKHFDKDSLANEFPVSRSMTMSHKTLFFSLAALLCGLAVSSRAQAYGCAHVGYTAVGPGGAYHAGATAYGGGYAAGGYRSGGSAGGAVAGYGPGGNYGAAVGVRGPNGSGGAVNYDGYHYGEYTINNSSGYSR
jgi:hypothetical protein